MTIHDASTMLLAKALGVAELTDHEEEAARATLAAHVVDVRTRAATEALDAARGLVASARPDALDQPIQALRLAHARWTAIVQSMWRRTERVTTAPTTARDEDDT